MDKSRLSDLVFACITGMITIFGLSPIILIMYSTFVKGIGVIYSKGLINFLIGIPPPPGGGIGGIGPALFGTLFLVGISSVIGIPLSIGLSLLATEFPKNILAKAVRNLTKALLELPTIAVSMVIYTLMVVPMGKPSLFAGAIALSIVMLPYTTTYIETYLESVPTIYREAAYSIGMKKARTALRVVMGIARRGIAVGVVMGVSRAFGETAPLLFTLGSARYFYPTGILDPGDSISLLIYNFALTPYKNLIDMAWGAALVLLLGYLLLVITVRVAIRGVRI